MLTTVLLAAAFPFFAFGLICAVGGVWCSMGGTEEPIQEQECGS